MASTFPPRHQIQCTRIFTFITHKEYYSCSALLCQAKHESSSNKYMISMRNSYQTTVSELTSAAEKKLTCTAEIYYIWTYIGQHVVSIAICKMHWYWVLLRHSSIYVRATIHSSVRKIIARWSCSWLKKNVSVSITSNLINVKTVHC